MKWPKTLTIVDARKIQEQLRKKVEIIPFRGEPEYVAGVDAAFSDDEVFAAVCLYRYDNLALVEEAHTVENLTPWRISPSPTCRAIFHSGKALLLSQQ